MPSERRGTSGESYVVTAEYLIPVSRPWLRRAWIQVSSGRIEGLGAGDPPPDSGPRFDFPGAALMPALVNAHTHLACHFLKNTERDLNFSQWLQSGVAPRVIAAARDEPQVLQDAADRAVDELLRGGVGTVADGFFHPAGRDALCRAGLRGTFFREQFGSMSENLDDYCEAAIAQIKSDSDSPVSEGMVRPGVAPHSPYTCPPQVMRRVVAEARERGLRTSIHLAESIEESDFLERRRGPLFDAFASGERGRRYEFGASPVASLDTWGILGSDVLAVHAVQLSASDIQILAQTKTPVVHCPSSNLSLSTGVAPLLELREAGVLCALGTDSGASVGKLDMFEEMRLAILSQRSRATRPRTKFGAHDVLEMATRGGARALGLGETIGALEVGMRADFCLVNLEKSRHRDFDDPVEALVWAGTPDDVVALAVDGRFLLGGAAS